MVVAGTDRSNLGTIPKCNVSREGNLEIGDRSLAPIVRVLKSVFGFESLRNETYSSHGLATHGNTELLLRSVKG